MRFSKSLAVLGRLSILSLGLSGLLSCTSASPGSDGGGTSDLVRPGDLAVATDGPAIPGPDLASRRNSGDCTDSRDCPAGTCVELSPGGYRVCATAVPPAAACSARPELDQCCKSADCPGPAQQCYQWPLSPYCGGPPPPVHNVCVSDACTTSADCPGLAVCVPSGVFGNKIRQCLAVSCRRDGDCTTAPGGQCLPIKDPCCGAVRGLFCVYPGSCRSNTDCPGGYCEPVGATTQCKSGAPPCPV